MREQEIIEALRRREEAGMDALLLHYRPLLQYIIAPILQNPQDREDCLSEVSLRIWEKIEQFDPQRGSWSAWLTALTRNTALNHTRNARRHGAAEVLSEHMPSPAQSPEEAMLQKERQAAVASAAQGQDAVLPEILLPAAHGADRRRAGSDGASRGGQALPPEKAAAQNVGR